MRTYKILAAAALIFALGGATCYAQTAQQDLEQYINSNPELRADPNLINNPRYLAAHPQLQHFLDTHPNVDRARYRGGAFDNDRQWRDADWWHQHDPNWVAEHHPNWNQEHPQWANNEEPHQGYGAYDEKHKWRAREWWDKHHPDWVKEHHPEWAAEHGHPPYGNPPYGNPPPPGHTPYGNGKYSE
jgi:hypothetical protein